MEPGRIRQDHQFTGTFLDLQLHLLLQQLGPTDGRDLADQEVQIYGFFPELNFPTGDAAKVEQIVDQFSFQEDVAFDDREVVPDFSREGLLLLHLSYRHEQGSQGGAKFVAEHGKKVVLAPVGRLGRLLGLLEGIFDPAAFGDIREITNHAMLPVR